MKKQSQWSLKSEEATKNEEATKKPSKTKKLKTHKMTPKTFHLQYKNTKKKKKLKQ